MKNCFYLHIVTNKTCNVSFDSNIATNNTFKDKNTTTIKTNKKELYCYITPFSSKNKTYLPYAEKINLEEINKTANRETGNNIITEVSNFVRESISAEYLFVRYMGPKFVLVFCGVETSSAMDFVNELKESTEKLKVSLREENYSEQQIVENKKSTKPKKKSKKVSKNTK